MKKPEIRLKLLMQCVNAILALPLPAAGLNMLYKRKEKKPERIKQKKKVPACFFFSILFLGKIFAPVGVS